VTGVDYVAKAAPDGRTLLLLDISAVLHKWLHKSVPFDVIEDFVPIAQVATTRSSCSRILPFPSLM
jgi:tripartite-type tricarboxylate transporter receptor subunit TctC